MQGFLIVGQFANELKDIADIWWKTAISDVELELIKHAGRLTLLGREPDRRLIRHFASGFRKGIV